MIDKEEHFRLGKYECPVPPVSYQQWTTQDWINYIDSEGKWTYD